jgi:HlyD family secretion protein
MTGQARDPRQAISRLNIIGFIIVAICVGGVGGWAATTQLAGAVIASGTVMVESNVKKVQHPNGGIVGEIMVREGTPVQANQLLIRLDDTLAKATLGIVQSQLDALQAREARLIAERDNAEAIRFPSELMDRGSDAAMAATQAGEEKIFEARRSAREGQRSQLRERITQTTNEITGLSSQKEAKEQELNYITEELKGVSALYKRALVTVVRYNALQRDQARLQGEHGQLVAEIARAKARIAETGLQIIQLDQDFRSEVLRDLRDAQPKIAELQERKTAALDELKRIEIRAPQDGIVHQLSVHTVGGVIGKAETIMQIVPRQDTLIIEAKVAPTDIDQVAIGATVRARIQAGNRRTTPEVEGTVLVISPDLARDQPGVPLGPQNPGYYLVKIQLPESEVKRLGDLQLVPGMPADVFITTQDRTPLSYLLRPLEEQIARTFRER